MIKVNSVEMRLSEQQIAEQFDHKSIAANRR